MDLLIVIYLHFLEICQKINLFGHGSNEKVALNLKLFQRVFRVFNGCWYPFRKVIVSQDQGNQLVGKYALGYATLKRIVAKINILERCRPYF